MAERHFLDAVQREEEIVKFTLVVNAPRGYFVEQCHESLKPFKGPQTHLIQRENLSKYWINDVSLVQLVERKFEEISRQEISLSAA